MTLLVLVVAGLVTGLVLGALGGGGAILTVPVLVYLVGQSAQEATTASLVVVGVSSLVGLLGHARAGNVRWRLGAAFGAAGVATAVLGTAVNRHVDERHLLLGFAVVMALAASAMLARGDDDRDAPDPVGGAGAATAATLVRTDLPRAPARSATVANVVAAGLVVGFLTGFFGVGGGFVVVPALLVALRLPMPVAVGTSLLVIGVNSAAALSARWGQPVDWAVVAPFTLVAVGATVAGQRLARRVPAPALQRSFAALLLGVAALVAGHSALSMI